MTAEERKNNHPDLQAIVEFHRIIKNYMQMVKLLEEGKSEEV